MRTGFRGAIFDVDGVLVDSPHERAWRETLRELMDTRWSDIRASCTYAPDRFTTGVYQDAVSGKPRLSGARAVLDHFHVPDADTRAATYAARKQQRVVELIAAGEFEPFQDALRFVLALSRRGLRLAAASSSKNAAHMLAQIRVDTRRPSATGRLRGGPIRTGLRAAVNRTRTSSWPPARRWAWRPGSASWSRTPSWASRPPRPAAWRHSAWRERTTPSG